MKKEDIYSVYFKVALVLSKFFRFYIVLSFNVTFVFNKCLKFAENGNDFAGSLHI